MSDMYVCVQERLKHVADTQGCIAATCERISFRGTFQWLLGLVAWFSLRVREVPGSILGAAPARSLAVAMRVPHGLRGAGV